MGKNKTISISMPTPFANLFYFIMAIATAIVGYSVHGSIGWSVVDFFFWPFAWAKWLICQEVNITLIKHAFDWFLK